MRGGPSRADGIEVTSPVFAGKSMLESQRMVYGAIADLMKGDRAPVHAVDSLKTRTSTEQRQPGEWHE